MLGEFSGIFFAVANFLVGILHGGEIPAEGEYA
jgi:hypothetical protein